MCRLPQPSPMLRKLGRYLHQEMIEHGELSFVVWEQSGVPMLQHMDRQPLSQKVVEKMIREHKFEMERFVFQIRDKVLPTHINLCFGDMTMVPISGFPRSLLLTADNHNSSPRVSQSALPMFQVGHGAVSRAASRYTHGSRRLKRGAVWEPPSLQDSRSIPDLRQYGDPDRVIGLEVVNQQAAEGIGYGSSMPEVVPVESKPAPVKRPAAAQYLAEEEQPGLEVMLPEGIEVAPVNWKPATVKLYTAQQQQKPQEQPSARTTLRNAFRALLWPIRAHPPDRDDVFPEEDEDEAMSQFMPSETGRPPPYKQDGRPSEHATGMSSGPYSPSSGPMTMQYYHVDSAENTIYHQWVNLLGPSMGGTWVPVNQAGQETSRRAKVPAASELDGHTAAELPANSHLAVELSDFNYHS